MAEVFPWTVLRKNAFYNSLSGKNSSVPFIDTKVFTFEDATAELGAEARKNASDPRIGV